MTPRILITGQAVSGEGRRALLTCDQARRPNVIVFRYRVAEPAKLLEISVATLRPRSSTRSSSFTRDKHYAGGASSAACCTCQDPDVSSEE